MEPGQLLPTSSAESGKPCVVIKQSSDEIRFVIKRRLLRSAILAVDLGRHGLPRFQRLPDDERWEFIRRAIDKRKQSADGKLVVPLLPLLESDAAALKAVYDEAVDLWCGDDKTRKALIDTQRACRALNDT